MIDKLGSSLFVPHLLLHGVMVQKGNEIHRDITYDTPLQAGPAHTGADGVQSFWVYRALRNNGAYSFKFATTMELVSTREHGHFTPWLQQQIYCQTGDTV